MKNKNDKSTKETSKIDKVNKKKIDDFKDILGLNGISEKRLKTISDKDVIKLIEHYTTNIINKDVIESNKHNNILTRFFYWLIKDKPSTIKCKILNPLKETVIKKQSISDQFFIYEGILYYLNLSCLIIEKGEYVILYRYGVSEPLNLKTEPLELIISKELTEAYKGKIVKDFRTAESFDLIEKIRQDIYYVIIGEAILILLVFWLVTKSNTILNNIKPQIEQIAEILKLLGG